MAFTLTDIGPRAVLRAYKDMTQAQKDTIIPAPVDENTVYQLTEEIPEAEKVAILAEWNANLLAQKRQRAEEKLTAAATARAKAVNPDYDDQVDKIVRLLGSNNPQLNRCRAICQHAETKRTAIGNMNETQLDNYDPDKEPGWPT